MSNDSKQGTGCRKKKQVFLGSSRRRRRKCGRATGALRRGGAGEGEKKPWRRRARRGGKKNSWQLFSSFLPSPLLISWTSETFSTSSSFLLLSSAKFFPLISQAVCPQKEEGEGGGGRSGDCQNHSPIVLSSPRRRRRRRRRRKRPFLLTSQVQLFPLVRSDVKTSFPSLDFASFLPSFQSQREGREGEGTNIRASFLRCSLFTTERGLLRGGEGRREREGGGKKKGFRRTLKRERMEREWEHENQWDTICHEE